jgi:hypothetical protein
MSYALCVLNERPVMCHFAVGGRVCWAHDPDQFVAPAVCVSALRFRSYLSCFHFKIAAMNSGGLSGGFC